MQSQIEVDRILRVRTKSDLGSGDVSAVTGHGVEALVKRIRERLLPGHDLKSTNLLVTHERHFHALQSAASALGHAHASSHRSEPVDVIAVDVQEAIHQLGLVVGETTTEDLLDRIFGEFCIGK